MGGGRNEIACAVIGTALLMTSSSSSSMVEAAQQGSVQSSSNQTPRRAAFVRTPITNHSICIGSGLLLLVDAFLARPGSFASSASCCGYYCGTAGL